MVKSEGLIGTAECLTL